MGCCVCSRYARSGRLTIIELASSFVSRSAGLWFINEANLGRKCFRMTFRELMLSTWQINNVVQTTAQTLSIVFNLNSGSTTVTLLHRLIVSLFLLISRLAFLLQPQNMPNHSLQKAHNFLSRFPSFEKNPTRNLTVLRFSLWLYYFLNSSAFSASNPLPLVIFLTSRLQTIINATMCSEPEVMALIKFNNHAN